MLDGTAGIHADIPQAGMGGTQPARDMVVAGFGDRRGDRGHRHQRPKHRGHRHHQPAGDHDRVGFGDRRAGLQRHCLAGSPHLGVLRPAEGRGADRIHPGKDGVDRRRLFQRHEDQMDSGQCGGGEKAGRKGQTDVRHGRLVAHLAPHARRGARDGREQRLAHDALQHPYAAMGRGFAGVVRHPRLDDATGEVVERGIRRDEDHDLRPQGTHRGHRGRPAGSAVRADVRRARVGEKHLRHGVLPADEQRGKAHHIVEQPADDHRMEDRRQGRLRARREHLRRRVGRAVAARRAGDHPLVVRS